MSDEKDCTGCDYYDPEDDVCLALECYGTDCAPLPCEREAENAEK